MTEILNASESLVAFTQNNPDGRAERVRDADLIPWDSERAASEAQRLTVDVSPESLDVHLVGNGQATRIMIEMDRGHPRLVFWSGDHENPLASLYILPGAAVVSTGSRDQLFAPMSDAEAEALDFEGCLRDDCRVLAAPVEVAL